MTNYEPNVGDRVYWLDSGPKVYVVIDVRSTSPPGATVTVMRVGRDIEYYARADSLWPTAPTRLAHRRRR